MELDLDRLTVGHSLYPFVVAKIVYDVEHLIVWTTLGTDGGATVDFDTYVGT